MQSATYYRQQATKALRLRHAIATPDVIAMLERLARDYEDIAVDLENGAIDIVHPERLPQAGHME